MANSVDPDQMFHSAASDLGLQFAKAYLSKYLGIGLLQYVNISGPVLDDLLDK